MTATQRWTAVEQAQLLQRHQPCLRYDALEVYFADSAEQWTRNPANRLMRRDGPLVTPADGLSLAFLGTTYADGLPARPTDVIESSRDDYDAQYSALRSSDEALRNVIYGRAVESSTGLWLQYWFFYFLNDYELAWGIDLHEGDWEMIQLRIPPGASGPSDAVYAQHTYAELRTWESVGRLADERRREQQPVEPGDEHRPLVYVARGSHASFFEPGYHETDFYDLTDGLQRAKRPTTFVDVTEPPGWLEWPGRWGGRRTGFAGPAAPCRHAQWERPEALLTVARSHRRPPPPGAPHLIARQHDEHLVVEFDASASARPPVQLIVTVNCSDDHADPPRAFRFGIADVTRGTLETRIPLDRRKHYDVRIATVDAEGRPSPATIFLFEPPDALRLLVRRITSAAGRLLYAARRALGVEHGKRTTGPLA